MANWPGGTKIRLHAGASALLLWTPWPPCSLRVEATSALVALVAGFAIARQKAKIAFLDVRNIALEKSADDWRLVWSISLNRSSPLQRCRWVFLEVSADISSIGSV